MTGSVADAKDITQECFLALVRKACLFDPRRAQLRTWLIAVARNPCLHRCRNLWREDTKAEADAWAPPKGDEELIQVERDEMVRNAVRALPQSQREALYLFEFEELSLAQTAEILGIEPNAVKARLYPARERLKLTLRPLLKGRSETEKIHAK